MAGASQITKVILVVAPEHIPFARDVTGGFLVYDEDFEPIDNLDADIRIDGLRGAVSIAEGRHRWPGEQLVSLTDGWSVGPDPRSDPDYHLTDEDLARKYPDPDEDNRGLLTGPAATVA